METRRCKSRQPTHPGALLRELVLHELDITQTEFAKSLGVSRYIISEILHERKPITPDIALRLGQFLGNGANLWLNMQQSYDLWKLERNNHIVYNNIQKCAVAISW